MEEVKKGQQQPSQKPERKKFLFEPLGEAPAGFHARANWHDVANYLASMQKYIIGGLRTSKENATASAILSEIKQKTKTLQNDMMVAAGIRPGFKYTDFTPEIMDNLENLERLANALGDFALENGEPASKAFLGNIEGMMRIIFGCADGKHVCSIADVLTYVGSEEKKIARVSFCEDAAVAIKEQNLVRVITNLIRNAENAGATEVQILSMNTDDNGILTLEDNGPGMDYETAPALAARNFEYLKQNPVHGIGLLFARYHVQNAGGEIEMETAEGAGTKFTLTLPIVEPKQD